MIDETDAPGSDIGACHGGRTVTPPQILAIKVVEDQAVKRAAYRLTR